MVNKDVIVLMSVVLADRKQRKEGARLKRMKGVRVARTETGASTPLIKGAFEAASNGRRASPTVVCRALLSAPFVLYPFFSASPPTGA